MANTPVNGIGWYVKDDGTLIVPWKAGEGGGNVNNPYNNVTGYWGTSLEPNGTFGNGYLNSITQVGYGVPGRFALGQRPDSYLGLTQTPIIDQQRANIATKTAVGYGGPLGRYQFGSTGTAPQNAPLGWGRAPGTPGGAPAAAWQPQNYAPGMAAAQSKYNTGRDPRTNPTAPGANGGGMSGPGGLLGAGPTDPAQASAGVGGLVPNNSPSKGLLSQYSPNGSSAPFNTGWVPKTNVAAGSTNVGKLDWSKLSDADLAYAYSLGQQDPARYKNFVNDAINWGNANMASELMRVDYANPVSAMNFNSYNGPLAALAAQYNGSKVKKG